MCSRTNDYFRRKIGHFFTRRWSVRSKIDRASIHYLLVDLIRVVVPPTRDYRNTGGHGLAIKYLVDGVSVSV